MYKENNHQKEQAREGHNCRQITEKNELIILEVIARGFSTRSQLVPSFVVWPEEKSRKLMVYQPKNSIPSAFSLLYGDKWIMDYLFSM